MVSKIKIFSPATIANFGPGFDVFGVALESLGDTIIGEILDDDEGEIVIKDIIGAVPREVDKNTASISAVECIRVLRENYNIKPKSVALSVIKNIPQGGLGGSASSAVGGAVAINELFGRKLSESEIINASLNAEGKVSGYHLDNILPCFLGGLVLIKSYEPLRYVKFNPPKRLFCVIVNPMIMSYLTKDARKGIPKKEDVLKLNKRYLSGVLSGLKINNIKIIGENIRDDVVEPIRSMLIPGFYEVKSAALKFGALGVSISGSGPSVFAVTDEYGKAKKIGTAMKNAFLNNGMKRVVVIISKVSRSGVRVI